ncbi:hypothetical protein ITP53_22025 [Nonomuraea sp. K274]|uniref:Uncharacterized protein n=1 Tax=Nonomuraea cypriaca TaxID=1187855 RepID=A0A931EY32_9ACTN|nr:hypothetical protein [Nonomuraea cypriaca]MBF8188359.1 hypothetical protein [Nonomuraea cypriaca]
MTNNLEMSLAAELAAAARHAPRPADDLLVRVEEEHRRRRRHGVAGFAAAAAVVLLTAGAPFVIDAARGTPATPPPAVATTKAPVQEADPTYPPIEEVWPGAVHVVPATLPNGRPFRPEVFLDDHTVLVRTERDGNADKMDGLWAYDVAARTARLLVQVTPPPKTVVTASFVLADRDRLYWWTVRKQERKRIVDIWTAPRTGGTQRRLTTFEGVPGYGGIDLEIVGDKAVWTLWGKGGVFEMPLSGDTPRLLPGTSEYTLIGWPWAATPRHDYKQRSDKQVIFGDLLNIETGKRSKAPVEPFASCGISWCVKGGTLVGREGGARELPGMPDISPPALDRFLTLLQRGKDDGLRGQVLYDLATGRGADLGLRPAKKGMPTATLDYRARGLFRYDRDGEQVIVNLSAIR